MRPLGEEAVELEQVPREHQRGVPELAVGRGVAGVALVALGAAGPPS